MTWMEVAKYRAELVMRFRCFATQARVHQYQAQISKLQLENESMRGQLRGLEAACAGEVHAALVARLATLETEHAALARDADAQRRQYERCLDDVANQVVRALLSQKVHCYALVTTSLICLSLSYSSFALFFYLLRSIFNSGSFTLYLFHFVS